MLSLNKFLLRRYLVTYYNYTKTLIVIIITRIRIVQEKIPEIYYILIDVSNYFLLSRGKFVLSNVIRK